MAVVLEALPGSLRIPDGPAAVRVCDGRSLWQFAHVLAWGFGEGLVGQCVYQRLGFGEDDEMSVHE